jgi:hypothetical protein
MFGAAERNDFVARHDRPNRAAVLNLAHLSLQAAGNAGRELDFTGRHPLP